MGYVIGLILFMIVVGFAGAIFNRIEELFDPNSSKNKARRADARDKFIQNFAPKIEEIDSIEKSWCAT